MLDAGEGDEWDFRLVSFEHKKAVHLGTEGYTGTARRLWGSLLRTLRSFWWETFTFCRDEQGRLWIMNEGISLMV